MNKGAELLVDWREKNDLTQGAAAVMMETYPSKLSRWECGRVVPGLKNAVKIDKVTKGAVPAESWLDAPEYEYD